MRDQRNDAIAFSAELRSSLGDAGAVKILKNLVEQKPQNYEYRTMFADALVESKQFELAITTIKEAQRILAASGNSRSDFTLRIADLYHALGQKDSLDFHLKVLTKTSLKKLREADKLRFVRLLNSSRTPEAADEVFQQIAPKGDFFFMSDYYYSKGIILDSKFNKSGSIECYEKAINYNPYNLKALQNLISMYDSQANTIKANELRLKVENLINKININKQ